MKKKLIVTIIIISSIIIVLLIINIYGSSLSYKYEIQEPGGNDYVNIETAAHYLTSKITWLKCFLLYVIVNIGVMIIFLKNNLL